MKELMPLEILSHIEGATVSKSVEQLFEKLRKVKMENNEDDIIDRYLDNAISSEELREDIVIEASEIEKRLIIANFPSEKDNYLVVPKVIEE